MGLPRQDMMVSAGSALAHRWSCSLPSHPHHRAGESTPLAWKKIEGEEARGVGCRETGPLPTPPLSLGLRHGQIRRCTVAPKLTWPDLVLALQFWEAARGASEVLLSTKESARTEVHAAGEAKSIFLYWFFDYSCSSSKLQVLHFL